MSSSEKIIITNCPTCRVPLYKGDPTHSCDLERKIPRMEKTYIDFLDGVSASDVSTLKVKDAEYGGSWKRRGGVGAYMMAVRKSDRIEEQVKKHGWDIFTACEVDEREEGILDDIRDLRRYLLLIEAEILKRRIK